MLIDCLAAIIYIWLSTGFLLIHKRPVLIIQKRTYMIKLLAIAGLLAGAAALQGCSQKSMTTGQSQVGSGKWTSLFDGKSTNGWHTYGKSYAGTAWKVENTTLMLDPTVARETNQRGDLITDKEYENFHLQLEWKIAEGGNSGIIFLVNEDFEKYKNTYNTGPEMQVLDNDKHADAKIIKHRAGDLYDLISSSKETVKPVGEWNKAEVIANKGKLDLYLNGTNVVSTTMWDDNWKQMLSKSKFSKMPGFGIFKKGKIALQDHGDKVWYRNIKIKEL